jgi:hypothetical protein
MATRHREHRGSRVSELKLLIGYSTGKVNGCIEAEGFRHLHEARAVRTVTDDLQLSVWDPGCYLRPGANQHINSFVCILRREARDGEDCVTTAAD